HNLRAPRVTRHVARSQKRLSSCPTGEPVLSRRAHAEVDAGASVTLMKHQKEHVIFTSDDVVVVRHAVETLDEQPRDVVHWFLTLERDACLLTYRRRASVSTDYQRGPHLRRVSVGRIRHTRRVSASERHIAHAADDQSARARRSIQQSLAGVWM